MILSIIFLLGFLLRIIVAATTFGPWDTQSVYIIFDLLKEGIPVYLETWRYNQPPAWLVMIEGLGRLAEWTSMPLSFWSKTPFILSDLGIAWLIIRFSKVYQLSKKTTYYLSAFYLFSPVAIFVSAYHGQLDSLICFLTLLSAYILVKKEKISTQNLLLSGIILGLAGTVKLVPLGFAPVFSIYLFKKFWQLKISRWRIFLTLLVFNLLVFTPVILFFIPYLDQWEGIKKHVFGYQTAWGIWGVSMLLRRVTEINNLPEVIYYLRDISKNQSLVIGSVVIFSYLTIFIGKFKLLEAIFFQFLTVLAFSAYVAPQYLLWVVPFWIILRSNLKIYLLYNLFVICLYLILFSDWDIPDLFLFLGNKMGVNDRVLLVNVYTVPVLLAWLLILIQWFKFVKSHVKFNK